MTTTWAAVLGANDGAGAHGHMLDDDVTTNMGVAPAELTWTLETFQVTDATADPGGIRDESRIVAVERLYAECAAPALIVVETPSGRLVHIDGWHRLGAAWRLGMTEVPAYVGRLSHTVGVGR